MKVAELVAAFQRFATTQNSADGAGPREIPPERPSAARIESVPPKPAAETEDQISVSPEAVFTFAASQFDPERITRSDIESLATILLDGGAISQRDRAILASSPKGQLQTALFDSDPSTPINLVSDFQGRLAVDLANSNISGVEEDTRALSILGRLASIRHELGQ